VGTFGSRNTLIVLLSDLVEAAELLLLHDCYNQAVRPATILAQMFSPIQQTKMKYLIAALWFLFSGVGAYPSEILPPARYDHPYNGEVIATEISNEPRLRKICEGFGSIFTQPVAIACAFTLCGKCFIFSIPDADIKAWGHTLETVLRHERAHCNGWPPDHPR